MSESSIFCISCGAANPPQARFCYKCGASIHMEEADKTVSPAQATPSPVIPSKPVRLPLFTKKEKLIGLTVWMVLYLALSIGGILFFGGKAITFESINQQAQSAIHAGGITEALAKFDSYQSFTVHTVVVETYLDSNNQDVWHDDIVEKVDMSGQVSLNVETDTGGEYFDTFTYQQLCLGGDHYNLDETDLFKPSAQTCSLNYPVIPKLEINAAALRAGNFQYIGEAIAEDVPVQEYQITLTEAQLTNPDLLYKVTKDNPVVTFYVSKTNGNLVRMEYFIDKLEASYGNPFSYQATVDYSDWDSTSFAVPSYVQRDETGAQEFTGGTTSNLAFTFPKVYQLSSADTLVSLFTPSGAHLFFFQDFGFFLLGDFKDMLWLDPSLSKPTTCDDFANTYVMDYRLTDSSKTLVSSTQMQGSQLNFCQAIVNVSGEARVYYLLVEPLDVTIEQGRDEPYVLVITATPGEDDDPATIFLDMIRSFHYE